MSIVDTIDTAKIKKSADYIRYLALESIERANSGHPGLPLGNADLGILLYRYILKYHSPAPRWPNRDRFILSAGHGSMLLYPLLNAAGYGISLEDMGNFRQLGSKTPGHPEYALDCGIETTTGPLGPRRDAPVIELGPIGPGVRQCRGRGHRRENAGPNV